MIGNLAELNGSNGFSVEGSETTDQAGYSVSGVGDINNDGFDDIAIGVRFAEDPSIGIDAGKIYVVFGKSGGFPTVADYASLDGADGFILTGETNSSYAGSSVSAAGDLNGDGVDDLVVGAQGSDAVAQDGGGAYVIFGSETGFAAEISLSPVFSLDGSNGFRINPAAYQQELGASVSAAGDVNGDGFDDVIVGGHSYGTNTLPGLEPGSAYVVFGTDAGFPATVAAGGLNGNDGFHIVGEVAGDKFGRSVAGVGDINNDGIDDVIVGAPEVDGAGGTNTGAAYVIFGKASGFSASFSASTLSGSTGFKIDGFTAGDQAGLSVAGLGDVNGDSIGDFAVGAFAADPGGRSNAGEVYVVYGSASGFGSGLDVSALDGTNGFVVQGGAADDFTGYAVAGAGDVNSDGLNDIIFGAHGAIVGGNDNAGKIYVLYGRSGAVSPSFELDTLNSLTGFEIGGVDVDDIAGVATGGGFDINGDGISDFISGANLADGSSNLKPNAGEAHVVFGLGAPHVSRYQDGTFTALLSHHYDFSQALAAAAANEAVDVSLPERVGDIGTATVAVDGLAIRANTPFAGNLVLGPAAHSLDIRGLNDIAISGNAADNTISASNGDNLIDGVGGADRLLGGLGKDTLAGGSGNDTLFGGLGADVIHAGEDNDRASGGGGSDTITGEGGADTLFGIGGDDSLAGGDGDDVLRGGSGSDTLLGEGGNDVIFAGAGSDISVSGGAGRDTMFGEGGADSLSGGDDADVLLGGAGADTLFGENGNDTLRGQDGADRLEGGIGADILLGGKAFDTIIGGDGDDLLAGGVGDDNLAGGAGNDRLEGSQGDDSLQGGDGNDTMSGGGGKDAISGGDGDDVINAGAGNDGGVFGDAGSDKINGGSGNDAIDGGADNDILHGDGGADTILGGGGDDVIDGGGVGDVLDGGAGADTVSGGSGNDLLIVRSGEGGDVLSGGSAQDTFQFESGFGLSTIDDFTQGLDVIDLSKTSATSLADLSISYTTHTVIDIGGGDTLTLAGIIGGISSADFVF